MGGGTHLNMWGFQGVTSTQILDGNFEKYESIYDDDDDADLGSLRGQPLPEVSGFSVHSEVLVWRFCWLCCR